MALPAQDTVEKKIEKFEAQSNWLKLRNVHEMCRRTRGLALKENFAEEEIKEEIKLESGEKEGKHSWYHSMTRIHSHRWFALAWRRCSAIMVWGSVINFVLETEIVFQNCCTPYFNIFEWIVSVAFFIEFVLKILAAPEKKEFKESKDARTRWIFDWRCWTDFLAWSPLFIAMLIGLNPDKSELFRMLRLIRIFKLDLVLRSFRLLDRVVYYNHEILLSSLFVCSIQLLIGSIALYYTRPPDDPKDNFSSVLACMYLSILMLTGQGEPNGVMPWYTRIIISLTALFAIAQFAIPASMLTWGFEQEAEWDIKKKNKKCAKTAAIIKENAAREVEGKDAIQSSSSSDASDRDAEWNGYLQQLDVLSDSSADDEKSKLPQTLKPAESFSATETPSMSMVLKDLSLGNKDLSDREKKRGKAIFKKLDSDGDGFLNWHKVRKITQSEESAKALCETLGSFAKEVLGNKKITLQEFYAWLCYVKESNNTRFRDDPKKGTKVLHHLLSHMESSIFTADETKEPSQTQFVGRRRHTAIGIAMKEKVEKKARKEISAAKLQRGADAPRKARTEDEATQDLLKATGFTDLQHENADLEKKVFELEKQLRELKAEQ